MISSGSGIYHEGGNVSTAEVARHLQIWVAPEALNTKPRVDVKKQSPSAVLHNWELLVSPDEINHSLKINQHTWISRGRFKPAENIEYALYGKDTGIMMYIIKGEIEHELQQITAGDTLFITNSDQIYVRPTQEVELLLIETTLS